MGLFKKKDPAPIPVEPTVNTITPNITLPGQPNLTARMDSKPSAPTLPEAALAFYLQQYHGTISPEDTDKAGQWIELNLLFAIYAELYKLNQGH